MRGDVKQVKIDQGQDVQISVLVCVMADIEWGHDLAGTLIVADSWCQYHSWLPIQIDTRKPRPA